MVVLPTEPITFESSIIRVRLDNSIVCPRFYYYFFASPIGRTTVGAIVAAVVILTTGWTPIDPILSVLVSCLVLRSAWRLLQESVNELLEGAPRSLDVDALKRDLRRSIPEVRDVHHVHAWLVGEKTVMTLHVQVVPPYDHDGLLERMEEELGQPCTAVATGGLSGIITPYCRRRIRHDDSLLLRGLALIWRKNCENR